MQATAFDRARKLMASHAGTVARAKILGIVQSITLLAIFLVGSLLLVLLTSRGDGGVSRDVLTRLPEWADTRLAGESLGEPYFEDAGLLPFVAANLRDPNPFQRYVAILLLNVMTRVPTLHNNVGTLATLLAVILALFMVWTGISQARRKALATASSDAAALLRRQLHRQMYRLGQSSLPTEGTGPVVNLFSREVNDVRDGLSTEMDVRWTAPVLIAGLLVIALVNSWTSSLFLASLGALLWLASRALGKTNDTLSSVASRDLALQYYLLQEDLGLLRTVRVYGMEDVDKERFEEHLERHRQADVHRLVVQGQATQRKILLFGLAGILASGLLIHSVVERGASPASVFVVFGALVALYFPTARWIEMRRTLRQAERSAWGIFAYVERAPELQQPVGAQFVPPLKTKVSFENVTLQNARGRTILDGFSAEIRAGQKVAIMSLDEEAKYAIACLIPRLIDPRAGRVRFDSLDLRDVTLESIRAQVASVLQADLVFSDTVAANIGLGDESYDMPRIVEASKVAHAHQFIQDLPHGYDTLIGPMGEYLTGDQQYRIGLARALLHDPSIVILEEPPADLSDDLKNLIDDTTARLAVGRTLVILPHRLSTIRGCDQVIMIHNGRLDEAGTPRELQASNKLFRHLQYVEFNQFATGEIEAGQMNG